MLATSEISNEENFYCTSYSPVTNVQPTHSYFRLATGMEAIVPYDSGMSSDSYPETVPYLEITVQPTDKFRFRYKSESGSHGKLRGAVKNRAKTNFPTVKLHNSDSRDKIVIKASLYTNEANPRPHILELVGKNCSEGVCSEILSEDNTAIFRYLEIESKKKDELIAILSQNKIDLYGEDYDEEEIRREALNEYKALNTNAAILCFEAFCGNQPVCNKVFSSPIVNLKSASSDLKIIRLSLAAGRCSGGEDMILLCNKINKDDIKIRFYEKDENEAVSWEGYGIFNKSDVHHQVAIPFKTPQYYLNTEKTVYIELYQPSDDKSGVALKFTYIPDEIDALRFSKKRKFAPSEASVQLQDTMQASTSSQFISSPSDVSSGTEEEDLFLGNPGPSSSNENTFDTNFVEDIISLSPAELLNLLQNNTLIDSDNYLPLLENYPIEANMFTKDDEASAFEEEDDLNLSCQMDSASKFPTVYSDELDTGNGEATVSFTSRKSDHIFYKSVDYVSQLGDSFASYMQNSLSSITGGIKAASGLGASASTNNHIAKAQAQCYHIGGVVVGQMQSNIDYKKSTIPRPHGKAKLDCCLAANATNDTKNRVHSNKGSIKAASGLGASASMNNHIAQAQCYHIGGVVGQMQSNIDYKKSAIPRPHGKAELDCLEAANTTNDTKNLGHSNKYFEEFKKGISDILRNRGKDSFLRYVAKLMSVEDENGNLLLHLAVLEQSENVNLIAKILDIAPQNVNKQNKYKETCLHFATMKDNWKALLYLMKCKGNPSITNQDGNNCFHLAAKSNFVNSMKILLHPCLKQGKRIPSLDDLNYEGLSPLHLSVMNNAKECMQLLLQAGANVNVAETKTGCSPLHIAIDKHPSLVGSLLSHPDIDTDCTDFRGCTAYETLCQGSTSVEELLKVAHLNKDNEGPTILSFIETESRKSHELAAEIDDYESSYSETSSDSDSEDAPDLPTTNINHQDKLENIKNINCAQGNVDTFDEDQLCKILDANSGWKKLGHFIGFDERNLNGLKVLSKGSSPSKIILKKVKKLYGCDRETLKKVLLTAELEETVQMLESLNI